MAECWQVLEQVLALSADIHQSASSAVCCFFAAVLLSPSSLYHISFDSYDMDGKKEATEATRELPPSPSISSDELQIEGHTKNDQIDMLRLGRKQQMKRGFRQFSIIALTTLAMGTWMVLFVANTQALTNGGLAGLFWSYIWSMAGMSCIIASMSEMASMAPTVGGELVRCAAVHRPWTKASADSAQGNITGSASSARPSIRSCSAT